MEVLRVQRVSKSFGRLMAVADVSFSVRRGELLAIIGPNGAGKSSLFNLLTGVLRPDEGRIYFRGGDITGLPTRIIIRKGISRGFQLPSIFLDATVYENVRIAVQARRGDSFNPFLDHRRLHEVNSETEALLERLGLTIRKDTVAKYLSYGDKRLVEIAIALATRPQLLLLDEPMAGLSDLEKERIRGLIKELAQEWTTVFVEHDMDTVMSISQRILVMHQGTVIAEGTPEEIQANERVQEAYLGGWRADVGAT